MSSRSPSEPKAPGLDFDWEEDIFVALRNLARRFTTRAEKPGTLPLAPYQASLTTMARVISGRPIRVVGSRQDGGLRQDDILVPEAMAWTTDVQVNLEILKVRVALSSWLAVVLEGTDPPTDQNARAIWLLEHVVQARDALKADFDGFSSRWDDVAEVLVPQLGTSPFEVAVRSILEGYALPELPDKVPAKHLPLLWGRLLAVTVSPIADMPEDTQRKSNRDVQSEAHAPAPENVEVVGLDPKKKTDLPVHVFEKVETAEEFNGTVKDPDGEDDLNEHLEALEALNLEHMFRGGEDAGSIYRADVRLELDIPDVAVIRAGEQGITYDEWDQRKGQYRRDWAVVYPTYLGHGSSTWAADRAFEHRSLIAQLVRTMRAKRHRLKPQNRQRDGEDIDLEAAVQELAGRAAGHGGDTCLYSKRIRSLRSVATTVLVDLSLSSDSWVGDQRVLDVALESLVVLGETTHVLGDSLQVLGFASQTRNQVRVWELKGWSESWQTARSRLGDLTPQGYTRIGPALRHACAEVSKTLVQRKLVLMLTDGKPTDYDKYEGRYGVADVRQAVREAAATGVHIHALAIDQTAREHLPQMLGANHWSLLSSPGDLVRTLSEVYARLT